MVVKQYLWALQELFKIIEYVSNIFWTVADAMQMQSKKVDFLIIMFLS